jgi:Raf kinase inhibitor-like YbhB/YbcL family protein
VRVWAIGQNARLTTVAALVVLCTVVAHADTALATESFTLTSPDFGAGDTIPSRFTCTGRDRSPELRWSGVPEGTASFALIAEDPDAPSGTFTHWVLFNLPGREKDLPGGLPPRPSLSGGAIQGTNSFGSVGYRGPCPPPGSPHHYHFVLFALELSIDGNSKMTAEALRSAMRGHIKESTELVGTFSR